MRKVFVDKVNKFVEIFNPETGFYVRSGVMDENGKDTGTDPFMRCCPNLLDIGIMQTCVCSKKCAVDCYQKAIDRTGSNMSVENYEKIMKQCEGKVQQVALGGAGDVDTHENFREILELTRKHGVVPNFTTSGITMTPEKAKTCKDLCGAIAVSYHPVKGDYNNLANYSEKAVDMLIDAGVKTNIHYVLGRNSIDVAIDRLKNNSFPKGINAVVFLMYKPVGLGREENVLNVNDEKVKEFFNVIDTYKFDFKIGFDSCSSSGVLNFTNEINLESMDYCEGSRYSAYVDANMNMMPCSFANQNPDWFVNLNDYTIEEAWNSEVFERFRYSLSNSCKGCSGRDTCGGGCPIVNQITLCNREERSFAKI